MNSGHIDCRSSKETFLQFISADRERRRRERLVNASTRPIPSLTCISPSTLTCHSSYQCGPLVSFSLSFSLLVSPILLSLIHSDDQRHCELCNPLSSLSLSRARAYFILNRHSSMSSACSVFRYIYSFLHYSGWAQRCTLLSVLSTWVWLCVCHCHKGVRWQISFMFGMYDDVKLVSTNLIWFYFTNNIEENEQKAKECRWIEEIVTDERERERICKNEIKAAENKIKKEKSTNKTGIEVERSKSS